MIKHSVPLWHVSETPSTEMCIPSNLPPSHAPATREHNYPPPFADPRQTILDNPELLESNVERRKADEDKQQGCWMSHMESSTGIRFGQHSDERQS
ncbi:MAG: hypothetical protein FWD57_10055 [Polyangiaceae bacterium]|nr:hypothetical protein [Polyangiaceae bacterium]